ncbi:unnamed protein product, partial [Lymnaea stagnalis]
SRFAVTVLAQSCGTKSMEKKVISYKKEEFQSAQIDIQTMDTYARPEQVDYTEHVYETIEMDKTRNLNSEHTYETIDEETTSNQSLDFHWINWCPIILSSISMGLTM